LMDHYQTAHPGRPLAKNNAVPEVPVFATTQEQRQKFGRYSSQEPKEDRTRGGAHESSNQRRRSPARCYRCHERGHLQSDCRTRLFCKRCKSSNHSTENCTVQSIACTSVPVGKKDKCTTCTKLLNSGSLPCGHHNTRNRNLC